MDQPTLGVPIPEIDEDDGPPSGSEDVPQSSSPPVDARRQWLVAQLCVLAVCFVAFVRAAWVSDDAFIAFRAMANLDHGFGFVSNVGERVQGFTNPLWVLLLEPISALTHEIYFTSIIVSLVLSMAVAGLVVLRLSPRPLDGILAGIMLAFSRGFTDYATSGLENPLAHVLLVLLLVAYWRAEPTPRKAFQISLLTSLVAVTRMDLALLGAPILIHFLVSARQRTLVRHAAYGMVPFIAWELFSLVYYGFPFPNTAYAKLNVLVPTGTLIMQGFGYLMDSLALDPLTLIVVVFALASALVSRKASAIVPMIGVVLYVVYIITIGGDFMSGRFLTPCYVVSVAVLAANILPGLAIQWFLTISVVTLLIVLSAPFNPLKPTVEPCIVPDHGITDERSCYYDNTGLLRNVHHNDEGWGYQLHKYWQAGLKKRAGTERVYIDPLIGLGGYSAGPRVHIVDPAALTDPLLARIPFVPHGRWRIGHFYRSIPDGYLETLQTGENRIKDPCVHRYYDMLSQVIRGPLLSGARFKAMINLNLGRDSYLLSRQCRDQ